MSHAVENWDDDSDLEEVAMLSLRDSLPAAGRKSSVTYFEDLEEKEEEEEQWQEFEFPTDASAIAIKEAAKSGIPIAPNTPPSALVGGVIKKLGSPKKPAPKVEDWDDDLDIPDTLTCAVPAQRSFPDTVLQSTEGLASPYTRPKGSLLHGFEDFEADFELPRDKSMMDIIDQRRLRGVQPDRTDMDNDDWGEGSLGVRNAGTRRSSRSGRASALSIGSNFSPTASATTVDSEDEVLNGLELPPSLNFQKVLDQRKIQRVVPSGFSSSKAAVNAAKDDFFNDIEIGEGDILEGKKLTFNKNVKHGLTPQPISPQKKPATTLSFTNRSTRIPRPVLPSSFSTSNNLHSRIRLSPSTPALNADASTLSATPSRTFASAGGLSKKASMMSLRTDPASRGLSVKKSMPSLRSQPSSFTPQSRAPAVAPFRTFLPPGSREHSSHHISTKAIPDHDYNLRKRSKKALSPPIREQQSPSHPAIPDSLRREANAHKTLTKPLRSRHQWIGDELNMFDDLPTSAQKEKNFEVSPVGRGVPKTRSATATLRSQFAPSPQKATAPADLSRFMRDTAASRNAREQRMRSKSKRELNPRETPVPIRFNELRDGSARKEANVTLRTKKKAQKRPHLIKPLGQQTKSTKAILGMTYNPQLYRWEGNEAEVKDFAAIALTPPRPALISNITGRANGVRVVCGMVFDPVRMCWLKVNHNEEEDPFEGLDDLQEISSVNTDGRDGRGEFVVGEEFDVGPEFIRRQTEEENLWRSMVDGWIDEEFVSSRDRYWDLRKMVQRIPLN